MWITATVCKNPLLCKSAYSCIVVTMKLKSCSFQKPYDNKKQKDVHEGYLYVQEKRKSWTIYVMLCNSSILKKCNFLMAWVILLHNKDKRFILKNAIPYWFLYVKVESECIYLSSICLKKISHSKWSKSQYLHHCLFCCKYNTHP